jgi:DNA-binding LacI/PurR family transcriptional regulator
MTQLDQVRTGLNDGLNYVDLDFEAAIVQACTHLVELCHRRIAFLTFSEDWRLRGLGPAMRSLRAIHTASDRFGIAPVYRECPLEVERAYCATMKLMAHEPRPTAFVATHNTIAVGAIRALRDLQLQVPEDCSIIGVAIGNAAELVIPPLTSIAFSGHEVGRQAAHMLIQQLRGAEMLAQQVLVAPSLHIRRSTAPLLRRG